MKLRRYYEFTGRVIAWALYAERLEQQTVDAERRMDAQNKTICIQREAIVQLQTERFASRDLRAEED